MLTDAPGGTGAGPLLNELRGVLGEANLLTDPTLLAGYETDWTGRFRGSACCVARPSTTKEVAAVLSACRTHGTPVVPQGGNTGLVGGAVPRDGAVVLSSRRLADLGPVDADAGEVVAGAGTTLEDVQRLVRAAGWDFGIDLAARGSATIGGMLATNAGGLHVLRYGPMLDNVTGVEAVLADGTVVGSRPALRKENCGYKLPAVLAGSEGTLAVITRVQLRLVPLLPERAVALLALPALEVAVEVAGLLRRSLASLCALEVLFADGIGLLQQQRDLPLPFGEPHPVYLLCECASLASPVEDLAAAIAGAGPGVSASAFATEPAARARLWQYRDGLTEAVGAAGIPHKLDVALPIRRLAEFERRVRQLVAETAPGARLVLFGHIGDGNLHVNVLGPEPEDMSVDDAVLRLVASMGGSISAEHGIGVAKRDYLPLVRGDADIAWMRSVKRALDADGVLNPGVLLPG